MRTPQNVEKKDAERVRSCFARAMMCSVIFHRVVKLGLSKTRSFVSSLHVEIIFYYINLYYIILLGREGASGHHTCCGSEEGSGCQHGFRVTFH